MLVRLLRQYRQMPSRDHDRRQHVLEGREFRQQVIELEDHAQAAIADPIALARRQIVDPPAFEMHFARVGCVERGQQVQQRALARPALPHHGRELAAAGGEVDAAEHGNGDLPLAEALVQAVRHEQLLGHFRFAARRRCAGPGTACDCGRTGGPNDDGTGRSGGRTIHNARPPRDVVVQRAGRATRWPTRQSPRHRP